MQARCSSIKAIGQAEPPTIAIPMDFIYRAPGRHPVWFRSSSQSVPSPAGIVNEKSRLGKTQVSISIAWPLPVRATEQPVAEQRSLDEARMTP